MRANIDFRYAILDTRSTLNIFPICLFFTLRFSPFIFLRFPSVFSAALHCFLLSASPPFVSLVLRSKFTGRKKSKHARSRYSAAANNNLRCFVLFAAWKRHDMYKYYEQRVSVLHFMAYHVVPCSLKERLICSFSLLSLFPQRWTGFLRKSCWLRSWLVLVNIRKKRGIVTQKQPVMFTVERNDVSRYFYCCTCLSVETTHSLRSIKLVVDVNILHMYILGEKIHWLPVLHFIIFLFVFLIFLYLSRLFSMKASGLFERSATRTSKAFKVN